MATPSLNTGVVWLTYIEGWLPIEGLSETPVGEELGSVTRDNWAKFLPV